MPPPPPLRGPFPHHPHWHPIPDRGPWDRVHNEAHGRRPGWRRRIQNELHLYYGAHLHRKIFLSFGAVIMITVLEIAVVNHVFHGTVGQRPWRAFLFFGVPVLLLWSASGRLARRISRPLYELTRVAQKIGAGDLGARAPLPRDATGEIVTLSTSVNDMATRLSGELARQRELLAAVSHELRTPLARMRLVIEIAREGGIRPDTLNEIERESIEIDALVGELLASARLEFQVVSPKPLEASEVARRALARAGISTDKLHAPPEEVKFTADPTLVARALANLISNARKHGGGLETLTVTALPGVVRFDVADRGPGFAPGEESRIFNSFFRGRHADAGVKTPDAPEHTGSLGLGLSLVKRIAEAHGGSVTAKNRPGGGAVVSLELAIAPPQPAAREA
jgi:signal transduction histidine kinase